MPTDRNVLPPLDYLLAFEAAAQTGSFVGAAQRLNISECAISRKVRLLEQHYETALFVRGHRSIRLTPQGGNLLKSVEGSLAGLREASRDLLSHRQNNAVNLAATNSVSSLWLMPRLRKFTRSNKQIEIMLVSSDSDQECLADTMDLTILRGEGTWPGYQSKLLFGETIFPVCAPGYLKSNPNAAQLQNLPHLDLIEVDSEHKEWMDWKNWLANKGIEGTKLERTARFNTYPLAIQAAVDGLGLALGWRHLVDHLLDSGQLVRPMGEKCVRTQSGYYLLKPEGRISFAELDIVQAWLIKESDARERYSM